MGKRINTAQWMEKQQRWQIKVQKDNERKTFYSSKPGRIGQREANAKADAWLDDNIDSANARIENLYNQYLQEVKITTSHSNWVQADSIGRVWILPNIGKLRISKLNEQHIQIIINKAFAKGLSKKSLLNIRAVASNFLKYCRKCKATTLYLENIQIPVGAVSNDKRILQPDDLKKLFSSDETLHFGKPEKDVFIHAYRFQILTGLRPGELVGLQWDDVQGNTINIQRAVNWFGEETQGKNKNAKRSFILTDLAKKELEKQRTISTTKSVFEISSQKYYYTRWKAYCAHNQIQPISLYEMRHTFVSIAKNLSEGQIKNLVGHSRNMDTFGVYGHEMQGEMQQTAQQLEQIFSSILSPNSSSTQQEKLEQMYSLLQDVLKSGL